MIRILRQGFGCSWRKSAEACYTIWDDADWSPPSDQTTGREFCTAAANTLGEGPDGGPWN